MKNGENSKTPSLEYPKPDSFGSWPILTSEEDIARNAGIDKGKLDRVFEMQDFLFGGQNSSAVVVRNGQIVYEHASFMGLHTSRFDVWSCTKSVTGTAWGLLFEDSRNGRLKDGLQVDLDTPAYRFLPQILALSDLRKSGITIGQLLSMTSGIKGEDQGLYGVPTTAQNGPLEHALGYCDNRYERSAAELSHEPGIEWEYSDPCLTSAPLGQN